jgi:hypothetical protein
MTLGSRNTRTGLFRLARTASAWFGCRYRYAMAPDVRNQARLAQDYEAATSKFAEAVRQLQHNIGTSTSAEYERLQRLSEEARVKSEQARLALEQHLAAHEC